MSGSSDRNEKTFSDIKKPSNSYRNKFTQLLVWMEINVTIVRILEIKMFHFWRYLKLIESLVTKVYLK
jgi:hypothetical protein